MMKFKALENPFVLYGYFGEAYFYGRRHKLAARTESFT
jgi:hypothetical protein